MARTIGKLTALTVSRLRDKGRYPDGGGLYLQVTGQGVRSWIFRFMRDGKPHEMGLGPLHAIGLADARQRAMDCRRKLIEGIDPLEERRQRKQQAWLAARKTISFQEAAEAYIKAHQPGWKNAKHGSQWSSTLETYAFRYSVACR